MTDASTLVTVAVLDQFHPTIVETLRRALPPGWELKLASGRTRDEQRQAVEGSEVCFAMAAPMDAALLDAAPTLRFIQKLGAGVDRIDIDACGARGIAVARLAGGNDVPVAEHTILMMLAALRRLPQMDRAVRAGRWEKEEARGVNRQLAGKTVGLVGFGAIGRAVAGMLTGFKVEIVYYDPVRAPADVEARLRARYSDLGSLLATVDIVSLHLPLTRETAGIIGRQRLASMKPGAVLVNCARGGLVDEQALCASLSSGRIFAAALDVFAHEPPTGSPLLDMPNIVLTPHLAGATLDNFAGVAVHAVANAQRFLRGEPIPDADLVVPPPAMSHGRRSRAAP